MNSVAWRSLLVVPTFLVSSVLSANDEKKEPDAPASPAVEQELIKADSAPDKERIREQEQAAEKERAADKERAMEKERAADKERAVEKKRAAEKERAEKEARVSEDEKSRAKRREMELRNHNRDRAIAEQKERLQALLEKTRVAEREGWGEDQRHRLTEEIREVEQQLKRLISEEGPRVGHDLPPEFRGQAEKIELASRRMRHVRTAAENLMAAEMPDLAHDLLRKAEGMERDIAAAKQELMQRMHQQGGERPHGNPEEVRALRQENQNLQRELQEVRQLVEKLRSERQPKE
jgi:hypothetical protein